MEVIEKLQSGLDEEKNDDEGSTDIGVSKSIDIIGDAMLDNSAVNLSNEKTEDNDESALKGNSSPDLPPKHENAEISKKRKHHVESKVSVEKPGDSDISSAPVKRGRGRPKGTAQN